MGWVVSFMPQLCFFSGKRTTSIQSQCWHLGERKIPFPCHKLHPTSSNHGLVAVLTAILAYPLQYYEATSYSKIAFYTSAFLSISRYSEYHCVLDCIDKGMSYFVDSPVGPQDVQLQKLELMMQIQYLMMFITNRLHDHQMMDKFDPKQ